MYVLMVYFISVSTMATTFDSSLQTFQTELGCETAKQLVLAEATKLKSDGFSSIVECIKDSK